MEKRKLRKSEHKLMCFNVSAGVLQTLQTHNKGRYMRQAFVTRDAPIDQSAIIIIRWYSVVQSEPPIRCRTASLIYYSPLSLAFPLSSSCFRFSWAWGFVKSSPTRKPATKTSRVVQQLNGGGSEPIVWLGHVVCRACVSVDHWKAFLAVAGWCGIWGSKSWTALGEVWISCLWKLQYYIIIFCK